MSPRSAPVATGWRTPLAIVLCGCLVGMLNFGPRSALGMFVTPISSAHGWGRDVLALALAIEMFVWGAALPVVGAIADRHGPVRVLIAGAVVYAVGLVWMANATTPGALHLSAGLMVGLGLAGSSFTLVLGAFAKLLPPQWRSLAFGAGTAAGSFGQFLFSPLAAVLIGSVGWRHTLFVFALLVLLIVPLAFVLRMPPEPAGGGRAQTLRSALAEAFAHRSYVLLVLGFFTCGFQLFFITVHLPAYLVDRGLSAQVGAWTIGTIGLANIIGALSVGWLGDRFPKPYLLAAIYALRAVAIAVFVLLPPSPGTAIAFGFVIGLLWLSSVPPTSSLVALMFGTRWFTTLFGFAFFSHQVGGFLGVWLGGVLFERTGSYDVVWWLSVALGIASALINLPIVEKPVVRRATA
ncbi:MAG TPA: MFS transporter [Xanthobacteraceae bacterium]